MRQANPVHIPAATYRIQLNFLYGFKTVRQIIPYFLKLGISDLYASPIFKAKPGSLHGYDVLNPNEFNPEIGTEQDFEELSQELKKNGIFWLQDTVPNHMAYHSRNALLMDVLENGQNSKYFKFFDIDWDHHFENLKGRLLAPFLNRFYAECLNNAELRLKIGQNGFTICYSDLEFPLSISTYAHVLKYNLDKLESTIGGNDPDFMKLKNAISSLEETADTKEIHYQYEHIKSAKETLWEVYQKNQIINKFLNETIAFFNGKQGEEKSFDNLDSLISAQSFRLSFWKVAIGEINYRRFFNINDLISLRMEDKDVFNHIHDLLLKLIRAGKIAGLRIDHIDGLYDPQDYLRRIRETAGPLYIVVEKILQEQEILPPFWGVQGTTGYDFLNQVNAVFCRKESEKEFVKIYYKFTGLHRSYEDLVYENKLMVALWNMGGTFENLAFLMKKIASSDRYGRDITFYELKRALVEFMVNLPVYRTYINQETFAETDRNYVKTAFDKALEKMPALFYELNFIARFFMVEPRQGLSEEKKRDFINFVMRLQQFTGPLMAKGFEDTVLYLYNKLISLNEVGGNPNKFGATVKEFHSFNKERLKKFPYSMNATSTHDTKRGEDVRARINVLSEIPSEWKRNLKSWNRLNLTKKIIRNKKFMPDENDEYFLYQTLLGSFPFYDSEVDNYEERIKNYMIKAVREAKVHTAWIKPDTEYEDACLNFIDALFRRSDDNAFLTEFLPFQRKIAFYGIFNSLSQVLLKITSPGIPDFYQGTELWDFNLVDPDNRRPVDFEKRTAFLEDIIDSGDKDIPALINRLFSTKEDGKIKLYLIYKALKARNANYNLFQRGRYIPLMIKGRFKANVISFLREYAGSSAIIIAPRFFSFLTKEGNLPLGNNVWLDTCVTLPKEKSYLLRNNITGEKIQSGQQLQVGNALSIFPVALLTNDIP